MNEQRQIPGKIGSRLLKNFTFVEVVAALLILALGLTAVLSLASSSRRRLNKAFDKWRRQHQLSQAAEYYLLAGPNASIPPEVFPYENVFVTCTITDPEGLPEDVNLNSGQWYLKTLRIEITSEKKGKDWMKLDKILRRDDL